jgi:hypothetical protein
MHAFLGYFFIISFLKEDTETVYRKQIRPVVVGGAEVMDRLFSRPEAPDA